ncbi:MAG TPA: alpha-L-arabinofuranosidase C-terminal domain-containing protein [Candidatus Omnitrophota bacterium]|nr:alpha-L-arabinofuranosidase C-terminal domain-containing protein [Candidatus Omnitrophota bacterium]
MAKMTTRGAAVWFIAGIILCACSRAQAGERAAIRIHAQKEAGRVSDMVFGANFIGYDPSTYEDWGSDFKGYADYGAGVWDPKQRRPVTEAMELVEKAGVRAIRFPGGCGAHWYDWKAAIGADRKRFLFGIDEFLRTCEETGAVPVITVSYFTGNESDAADLVEYLNSSNNGLNPNGGIDWAAMRARNGHPEPYGVAYFEFGNEVWHGDHRAIRSVSPEAYAKRFLAYWRAMKDVDPSIQIGAVLCEPKWDRGVMNIIRDRIDFGIVHMYPDPGVNSKEISGMAAQEIFSRTLERVGSIYEPMLKRTAGLVQEKAGKSMPLAVTEYNAGFIQDEPVPYRHSLGAALVNAELLRIMMKPEYRIMMANYWQFANSYWGMAYARDDYMGHDYTVPIEYIMRPNYFVYEQYKDHFGAVLVDAEIMPSTCGLSVNQSKSDDGNSIYLIVVNKNMERDVDCTIEFDDTAVVDRAGVWVLNGGSVDATNEAGGRAVCVAAGEMQGVDSVFSYCFERHSVTAMEFTRKDP